MIVMALATAVWWAAVAVQAPAALTGSNAARGSAAVPQLIVAMIVMLTACALASRGARVTTRALPCLNGYVHRG
jgi:thiamine transporter ThiT